MSRRTTAITYTLVVACVTSVGFAASAQDTGSSSSLAAITTLTNATATLPTNALRFSGNNVFQRDLRQAPTDPNSAAMVADLNHQVTSAWGGMAVVNSDQYANARVTASPDTPRVNLTWNNCQGKDPSEFATIKDAMTNVPIPPSATTSKGSDKELSVYDPTTQKLWEFWGADKGSDGHWSACWAGVMNAPQSNGQFPGTTGVSASGLAMAGMAPSLNEMATGVKQQLDGTADPNNPAINHAIYLAITNPAAWNNYVWPAVRSDGGSPGGTIPEGARLRLKPGTDVSHLTPLARAFAAAAKVYGFIVADKAGAVNISVQTADTDNPDPVIKNSFSVLSQGTDSWRQLADFPWDQLEVVDTHDKGNATPVLNQNPGPTQPPATTATVAASPTTPQTGTSSAPASNAPTTTGDPTTQPTDPATSTVSPTEPPAPGLNTTSPAQP